MTATQLFTETKPLDEVKASGNRVIVGFASRVLVVIHCQTVYRNVLNLASITVTLYCYCSSINGLSVQVVLRLTTSSWSPRLIALVYRSP